MENYLTEEKLGDELLKIFGKPFIRNFKIDKYRIDWYNIELSIAIEFDGYHHYSSTKTQMLDSSKDELLRLLGIQIIRVPYFIQLSKDVLNSIFLFVGNWTQDWTQTYPHGFISKPALLPSDFNENGVYRFIKDLNRVPRKVKYEILESLINKAKLIKNQSDFVKLTAVIPQSLLLNIPESISLTDSKLINLLDINTQL